MRFVDLAAQHDEVRAEIDQAFHAIVRDSAFVGGEHVDGFEEEFARHVGVPHAVGVSSGTDAVRLALQAVGVGAGDAVVTVAHTFIGTVEGAVQLGALPLFVDVDADTRTMSPAALERFLEQECRPESDALLHRASGRRVAAIVPVHLYGQPADMAPILDVARRHDVAVVEDAAQAHGARYTFPDGRVVACGAMGQAAAFSFYPGKNLGAIGEAGAVTSARPDVAEAARLLRDHGQASKYEHVIAHGGNYRLDAIQAAVLRIKLRRLDDWNEARRRCARLYAELLEGADVRLPVERDGARHVYHLYVVELADRDAVRRALDDDGIESGLHYPTPLHLQPAFASTTAGAGALPETERAARACLSLPMHPHLTPEQVERVARALSQATR